MMYKLAIMHVIELSLYVLHYENGETELYIVWTFQLKKIIFKYGFI